MARKLGAPRRIQADQSGSSHFRLMVGITTVLAFIVSTLAAFAVAFAPSASATGEVDNKDCPDGYFYIAKANLVGGEYVFEGDANGVTISEDSDGNGGAFTSVMPLSAITVKGSTDDKFVYFHPAVNSGDFDNSGLATPSENTPAISHVTFCGKPDVKVPVPATPSQNDPCGPNNAMWNVPADTDKLDWTLEADGDLVVATKPGYVFEDGTTSKNYGKAVDSNVACVTPPPVVDVCPNMPGNQPVGTVCTTPTPTPVPPAPYVCPPGTTWVDMDHDGVMEPGECKTPVKGAVKKLDKCEHNNFFKAVRVKGGHYMYMGKVVREGVWLKVKGSVAKIKFVADSSKYVVTGKSRFVLHFPNDASCSPVIVEQPHTGLP